MKKLLLFLAITFATINTPEATLPELELVELSSRNLFNTLVGSYNFDGDRHGDFVGDYVAILQDGSEWKIHPDDQEKFAKWLMNDLVHTEVRTSFYWFKREHKFSLKNHNNGDSVRAMLIRHAAYPLMIQSISEPFPTKTDVEAIRQSVFWEDENGNIHEDSIIIGYQDVPSCYKREIILSDGSIWWIKPNCDLCAFSMGQFVLVGYNDKSSGQRPFLLTGTEREAKWDWATRIH